MACQWLTRRRRMVIFLNLLLTCIALGLMSTAMSTALAPLIQDFGVDAALGQWVTSGYALALAVVMPLTAFLVTRFPSKPLYLIAVGSYALASVLCASAPSFEVLMVGRVLQACVNGLIANLTQVSILSLFEEGRGRAMGWFGLSQSAAVVAGPTVGGVLVDALGWRAIFIGVALIAAVSFAAAVFTLRNLLETAPKFFDPLSFVLSVLAFGGVTLGLGGVVSAGLTPLQVGELAVGFFAGAVFVARQIRSSQPFLKVQLLGIPPFRTAVVASMLLYACMSSSATLLPVFVQSSWEVSATDSGLMILPGALVMAAVSPLAGGIYDRFGIRVLGLAGAAVLLLSNVGTACFTASESLIAFAAFNVLRGIAVGCMLMPLATWANSVINAEDMPHGSALLTSLRNVSGALGVAVFVGLLQVAENGAAISFYGMTALSAVMLLLFLTIKKAA